MRNKTLHSDVQVKDIRLAPLLGRQLIPLVLVVVAFMILRHRIPSLDFAAVWSSIQQVSHLQWVLAALATMVSFWAVGRYDQILHGLMDTGVSPGQAQQSGSAAIAVAQFAGFGVLSSALVRWRLLPDITLVAALRISLAVSMSFLAGWAVVTSMVVLATNSDISFLRQAAFVILGLSVVTLAFLIRQPNWIANLPTVRAVISIVGLAFVDTLFAALALYVLLPDGLIIAPATLFAAYLVALGCGLIGGTPGGVGPFELAFVAMLPGISHEPLLATALAFRIVYYVLPASIAFLLLIRGPLAESALSKITVEQKQASPFLKPALERIIWGSPRAEMNLIRQGQFALVYSNDIPTALTAHAGQSLIMLTDTVAPTEQPSQVLRDVYDRAARQMRQLVVYKCSGRTAVAARSLGWHNLPIADEAWLQPNTFTTEGPKARQLRRLLRKAKAAEVRTVEAGRRLPLEDMQRVSEQWASEHGGERGFSMGRFGRDYVSCQRVFLSYQGEQLIAFITLHEVQQEWTLDLMRQVSDVPAGTMHLLVCHAIESAAAIGCPRLSLAAVPCFQAVGDHRLAWLRRRLVNASQTDGLRRFKACFDPHWSRLYAAAPSRFGLAIGLCSIYARINRVNQPLYTRNS